MINNIYDEIGRPSKRHIGAISKLTEPLRLFLGIDRFWRGSHKVDGAYSVVGNYPPTADFFFGQNLYLEHPYFRNPIFFQSGYALPEFFNCRDYENTQGKLKSEGDCFHVLIAIRKHENCFVEYGFATSKPQPGIETSYINHLPAINKFIDYFEENAKSIIQEADECQINVSELIGNKYNEKPILSRNIIVPEKELLFLSAIDKNSEGAEPFLLLSKSERNCIKHYLTGKTTKEIAEMIYRSPRTIESHLENAKTKLGIHTRSELFEIFSSYHNLL